MARISDRLSNIEVKILNAIVNKSNEEVKPSNPKKRKPRVGEIADEYGVDSKMALGVLKELGEFVKGPSSSIQVPVARKLRIALEEKGFQRLDLGDQSASGGQDIVVAKATRNSMPAGVTKTRNSPGPSGQHQGKSPKEQLQAKLYVFDRRKLDLRLTAFKHNPSSKNRALVISEYQKLNRTVTKRVSDPLERKNLLHKIQSEYLDFNSDNRSTKSSRESLFTKNVPTLGEKAIKPFRGLANRTPDGPQSDTYWDNPVQDR